ncbi:MAG: ABC transporter substrate-binding protein [Acetobacteraceae bacterium]|nr:ABC transporter substrate-binding protein [Acetobacteraceae bacterium]
MLSLAPPSRATERVVSLNLCTDQLLVLLAPEKVVALSTLARDPALSFVAPEARQLPQVRADAEAVVALRPDLVLAGQYGAQAAVAALKARGVKVLQLGLPDSFDAIRSQVRALAAALGAEAPGEALIAAMNRELAALPHPSPAPTAILLEPRGWTSSPGTLGDAVLRAAGYRDVGTGHAGLERLLAHPPDVLLTAEAPRFPSLATAMLEHPALRDLPRKRFAPALLTCAGPFTARAADEIAPGRSP